MLPHNQFWILNSGTNGHVCLSFHLFTSIHDIKPLNITFLNGHSIFVKQDGNIHFSSTFYLHNVLFSDKFLLNFISISKLCKSLKRKINFSINKYVIQDLNMMKMIDLGKQIGGLYRLQMDVCSLVDDTRPYPSISSSINTILHSNVLWHFRLVHVSNNNLSHMTLLYPSISFDNKATCDIFHLARQKKLPFCHSSSTTNSKFEILHLYICGPLSIPSVCHHKYFLISLMIIQDMCGLFFWKPKLKHLQKWSISSAWSKTNSTLHLKP